MHRNSVSILVAALAITAAPTVSAQFGLPMQLPENDFIWRWGSDASRGFADIDVFGSDGRFRCELTGKIRLSGRITSSETRDLEQQLRSSMQFVYEATYTMNQLDASGNLEWAILDCKQPVEDEDTEDEVAEREAKARERAERRRERRRASED